MRTHHWDDWSLADLLAAQGHDAGQPRGAGPQRGGHRRRRRRPGCARRWSTRWPCSTRSWSSTATPPTPPTTSPTDAGAVVHRAAEIRPDLGTVPGQGRGDVEVAVRHHRRRAGVHGRRPARLGHPLRAGPARPAARRRPRSQLVKGFYERPLATATAMPFDGGRVTELVARPLIALLLPELAGAACSRWPASGRSAARCSRALGAHRLRRRAGRAGRHRRAARASTRSPRSTSAAARTGTSRCSTSAAWPPRSWPPPAPASASRRRGDAAALRQFLPGPEAVDRLVPTTERPPAAELPMTLRLGRHAFADDATLMMAIVNRTPDSFYDQRRHLGRGQGVRAGRAGGRAGRRDRRHRRHQGRARRRDRRGRGEGARRRLRRPGAARPSPTWSSRSTPGGPSVGRRGLRGRRRRAQRRLGRRRPRAGRRRRGPRRRDRLHPHRRRHAAHPPLPGRVRRRRRAPRSTTPSPTPSGRWPPASPASRSSSTPPTTSARTPSTPSSSPAGSARWSPPAGRCWCRCPTRTSSARPSTGRSGSGCSARSPPPPSAPLAGARVYRVHEVRETRQVVDMAWTIAGRRPPARAIRGLQ